MKYLFALLLFLIGTFQGKAQPENSKSILGKDKGNTLLKVGLETSTISYINTVTNDSAGVGAYLAGDIDYNHKSGLGLNLKTYAVLAGHNPGIYLTTITPYFAKYTGKLLPYISYTRYLQNDNPSIPYSPIQNEIYAHLKINTRYLDPMLGLDFGFGNDEKDNNRSVSDINAFAGVSHLFAKENFGPKGKQAFGIRPLLQLNAGTDRYFEFLRSTSYLSHGSTASRMGYGGGRGTGNSGNSTSMTANTYLISESYDFGLSNIEANLYIIYFYGKFSLEPSGSLYFPLRGTDRTPFGYWQINLNYWIK